METIIAAIIGAGVAAVIFLGSRSLAKAQTEHTYQEMATECREELALTKAECRAEREAAEQRFNALQAELWDMRGQVNNLDTKVNGKREAT